MMESVRPYEQAVSGLAPGLRGRLLTLPHSVVAQAQELRLLLGQPPILRACNRSPVSYTHLTLPTICSV